MKRNLSIATLLLLTVAAVGTAQERKRLFGPRDCPPACDPCYPGMGTPHSPLDPNNPLTQPGQQPPTSDSAFNQALASAAEGGTQSESSLMPGFFGDLLSSIIYTNVVIPGGGGGGTIGSPNISQSSAIKVVESDSPRPMDRVYYVYNVFGNIEVSTTNFPGAPNMAVHRHVVGVEKTFLSGDASIGLRLPFFSLAGGSTAYSDRFAGDLSVISKYALINNPRTGNVLSGGLVVTAPTGGSPELVTSDPPPTRTRQERYFGVLFQPFAGYVWNVTSRIYFQGFHSVVVPTDSRETTFMSNGVGIGAWLYRNPNDEIIQGIVPTFEVHVNTPFDHRVATEAIGDTFMADSVNLTMGLYLIMARSQFGGAVGVPLAFGPHRIEAMASYTLRF